ncbi:MAG: CDP-alcohol phosphatidyltransferase family protein [Rhodobacteraceae bacterium]|nr:CDP-alcohol phosphatidyltransferase family protein [Paracoccaceae bacterium]
MIDATLLPLQRAMLRSPAAALATRGVRADQVTVTGFGIGLMAILALALQAYWLALVLILLNRLADGLDGAIARINGPTDRGAFLDIALDFVFYALVPVGFALADPARNALAASVLIAAFVGTGSSFLAFASIAAKRKMSAKSYPSKGIYYLGGLTEGAETIIFFAAICLFPAAFPLLAYLFALACVLTTISRWLMGWRAFSDTE